jgi:CHASE3 domain sensor protein
MRQQIFLGFASILILFLGIGICAFWLFSGMSGALNVIVGESQQWVLAGKAIKKSVERMDSTLSSAFTGEEKKGRKWFESYAPALEFLF